MSNERSKGKKVATVTALVVVLLCGGLVVTQWSKLLAWYQTEQLVGEWHLISLDIQGSNIRQHDLRPGYETIEISRSTVAFERRPDTLAHVGGLRPIRSPDSAPPKSGEFPFAWKESGKISMTASEPNAG
ncbi:MAG: hypothetical protein AAF517_26020, partial [Planctomycetota bacterium]